MSIQDKPDQIVQGKTGPVSRRAFLGLTGMSAAAFFLGGGLGQGPLHALGARTALGQTPGRTTGYGPLVAKTAQNDPSMVLNLPAQFNFEVISRQGQPMSDGNPTPGIFDGTGSFPGSDDDDDGDVTILIRNHENRRRPGEIPVVVPADKRYDPDPSYDAGDTKLVVERRSTGRNPDGTPRYTFRVRRSFAILGGTDTNCAGGVVGDTWYTCEEVVNRSAAGLKHGYNFVIPAYANGPVKAVPQPQQGRMAHEAVAALDGILYETEDRSIVPDTRNGVIGAAFYRFVPDRRRDDNDDDDGRAGFEGPGTLQALKLRDEPRANMDVGRIVGKPYPVEWVTIDVPDHDDDTDNRRDRQPRFTPTRIQAQDKGAAIFDREEGIWTTSGNPSDDDDEGGSGKVYFDCTSGGAANLGQVWEYDPEREVITLIFESTNPAQLENPDNVVIVPRTGDIFLQEDSDGDQFVRGLTPEGEIYDFAQTVTNDTEFCGGCFDADGLTFFVSQQGERSGNNSPGTFPSNPGEIEGTPSARAVTYAIYGPFEDRRDSGEEGTAPAERPPSSWLGTRKAPRYAPPTTALGGFRERLGLNLRVPYRGGDGVDRTAHHHPLDLRGEAHPRAREGPRNRRPRVQEGHLGRVSGGVAPERRCCPERRGLRGER